MTDKQFIQTATLINKYLGFKRLSNYKTLHGTTVNTWGQREASMWFVSYHRNENGSIRSVEVNSTYFIKAVPKAMELNEKLEMDNSVEAIFAILNLIGK